MKAVMQDAYGPPEVLRLRETDPPVIGDDELLIRVRAAGLDPGVWHLTTGLPYAGRLAFGLLGPKNPVRGLDLAGEVSAVGRHVTGFRPGDAVFGIGDGTFAEYARSRPDRLAPVPANLTLEQAAAVPVSGVTALRALRDSGRVTAGQRVLIIGAGGGVGTYAVQLAKAFGAWVTGVCSGAKAELVRSIGADEVIDYTREDVTDRPDRYDLVLDIAGNRTLARLRRILTPWGTLVLVGGEGGGRWLGGMDRLLRAGLLAPFTRQRLTGLLAVVRAPDLQILRGLIEAGQVTPIIDRTYPLAEVPTAIRYLAEGRARGKVVITG